MEQHWLPLATVCPGGAAGAPPASLAAVAAAEQLCLSNFTSAMLPLAEGGSQGSVVEGVGLWVWSAAADYTVGSLRVCVPMAAKADAGTEATAAMTRHSLNSALKAHLARCEGSHSFHNFAAAEGLSSFATSASQVLWKASCTGNVVIGDRGFVRLRFEARHFLPGQVARLAGLALAAVRLGPSRLPPALLAAALELDCVLRDVPVLPSEYLYF